MIKHGVVLASPGYAELSSGLRQGSGTKTGDGDSPVTCMDLSSSGQLLAVGRFNGNISFYRIRSCASSRLRAEPLMTMAPGRVDNALHAAVTSLSFSPCLCFLAVGTIRGAVSVIDMRSGDKETQNFELLYTCLLYTSPSPRDRTRSRMPSSA